MDEYDPITPQEWAALYAVGAACLVAGALLGFLGLLSYKQGVALMGALFLVGFMGLRQWRYKPLDEAVQLLDEGQFPAAQFVLEAYLAKPAGRGGRTLVKAKLLYAHVLWYLEQADRAMALVQELLADAKEPLLRLLCLNLMVSCYLQKRMPLKVQETMGTLLKLDGITPRQRWESQIAIGICAMNEELYHDAIDILQSATRSCEDDRRRAYVFGMLAAALNRVKDYVRALGAVQDGKKLKSDDPLTRSLLLDNFAFAKANLKQDLPEALAAADEGLGLGIGPALPHLYTSRGEVHYALRDFPKAMSDIEEALKRLPERDKNARQKAWFIKGKIHKARGEDELAREALSQAIGINSSRTIAMQAQAALASPEALDTLIQSGDIKISPPKLEIPK